MDFSAEQMQKLDRNGDHQVSYAELDINGDQMVTRNEVEYFKRTMQPSSAHLTQPVQPLPNRELTGPPLIQVNNPETVTNSGLLFSSIHSGGM